MSVYTHILWDFNGTILDDVDACIQSANRLLSNHGLAPIPSRDAYLRVFGFPIIDYYRRLGFDFEKTPYSELAPEWVRYYLEYSRSSAVYPDIPSALELVRSKGISQSILSATELSMLTSQVSALGILPYFDSILGMDTIHAYSKEGIALSWRSSHPDARVLVIGDTDHDFKVASAIGADCILVSCGHQPLSSLSRIPCLRVVSSPLAAVLEL